MYVLAALACREASTTSSGRSTASCRSLSPARLAPFKLVGRLVWDVGEYGRFVVGLRLINVANEDLIVPMSAAITIEPLEVEDLAGRTIVRDVPELRVAGPGMMLGVVSVNDREVARVPIRVGEKTPGEAAARG